MAGIDDFLKGGNIATGVAIGVGAALLAPMLKPVLRPVAKTVLKAGLAAYEEGKTALAELSERAEDVIAEARAEMEQEARREQAPAGPSLHETGNGGSRHRPSE